MNSSLWRLTSEVEVTLHGCRRTTAGPQEKPGNSQSPVNACEIHLLLVLSAPCLLSHIQTPFIHLWATRPRRGGVVSTIMWPTGLPRSAVYMGEGSLSVLAQLWHSGDHLDALQWA